MIRVAQPDGWTLITHGDHARLAAEFARAWGNAEFAAPDPHADVLAAVAHHDDAWAEPDATPSVTCDGRPAAFSQELVGTYAAFEEIDLADYLRVRGRATDLIAATNPYAAIIVSMHTVNLLTVQADTRSFTAAQGALHRRFIEGQLQRQRELAAIVARQPERATDVVPERLQRAFEFLQVCDSLSLIACVDFPRPMALRHRHPRRDGTLVEFQCTPRGRGVFRVAPWPFASRTITTHVPCRRIAGATFLDDASLRAAWNAAPKEHQVVQVMP